jgi:hypothetical protein
MERTFVNSCASDRQPVGGFLPTALHMMRDEVDCESGGSHAAD